MSTSAAMELTRIALYTICRSPLRLSQYTDGIGGDQLVARLLDPEKRLLIPSAQILIVGQGNKWEQRIIGYTRSAVRNSSRRELTQRISVAIILRRYQVLVPAYARGMR